MRKRRAVRREVLPDPVFKSKVVTKLINRNKGVERNVGA